jgi:hypothetical protein
MIDSECALESFDFDERTEVFINVYDLIPENDYVYSLGLGVYHTGVVVF